MSHLYFNTPVDEGNLVFTKDAYARMWDKIRAMSDDSLCTVWNALEGYHPGYWDETEGITMDDWAGALSAVLDERKIPHY